MTVDYDATASADEPAPRRSLPCPTEACTGEVYPWLNPYSCGDCERPRPFLLRGIEVSREAIVADLAAAMAKLTPERDVFAERVKAGPPPSPSGILNALGRSLPSSMVAAVAPPPVPPYRLPGVLGELSDGAGEAAMIRDRLLRSVGREGDADALALRVRIQAAFDDPRRTSPLDPIRLSTADWEALKRSAPPVHSSRPWERPLSSLFGINVLIEDPPPLAPETTPFPRGWLWRALDRLFRGSA